MQTGNRSRSVCVGSQEGNSTQWAYKARYPKIVCRFASPLDYANAEVLTNAVLELIGKFTFQASMVRLNIRSYTGG